MDAYQKEKYPELIHSLPNHGRSSKSHQSETFFHLYTKDGRMSQKQQVLESIDRVYTNSKSKDNFFSQLKFEGYEPYYRGSKLYGVEDEKGRHYRFNSLRFDKVKLDDLDKKQKVE